MTSRIAPATARNASDIAEPPPATGFHTTFQSTNKSLRGGGGGDGPADEESVKVVKEEIERVKTRLEEFERRNGRRTHAVVWVNVLIHGLLLVWGFKALQYIIEVLFMIQDSMSLMSNYLNKK